MLLSESTSYRPESRMLLQPLKELVQCRFIVAEPAKCQITLLSRIFDFQMVVDCQVVRADAIKYLVFNNPIEALQAFLSNLQLAETKLSNDSTDIIIGTEYVEDYQLNETIRVNRVTLPS